MPQTITALYDSATNAHAALATLATAGVPRTAIALIDGAAVGTTGRTSAHEPVALPSNASAVLEALSLTEAEQDLYDTALRRGSILMRLSIEEDQSARVLNILRDHGSVDLEERLESWRHEGWGGTTPVATEGWHGYSATSTSGKSVTKHTARMVGDDEVR